jgi:2-octaprenyl-6-methoxyphenol hydroxylase
MSPPSLLDSAISISPATGTQLDTVNAHSLDYDIAIVGGGIVGLTLACALRKSGFKIVLIEAQPQSAAAAKGQAYNISPLSRQMFETIGVWHLMQSQVAAYQQIVLSDGNSPQVVHFLPADLGMPELGHVAEHQVLLSALQEVAHGADTITVLCPAQVLSADYRADAVLLELQVGEERRSLRAQLVVAADGSRSPLRQQAGIQTRGWKYQQSCVVAFIQSEQGHHHTAYERFCPSGPFAILPLVNGLCRIVWTAPHVEAQEILALEPSAFLAQLRLRYGEQMGELTLVGDRFLFSVQLQQSRQYVRHRLALIGDAAHSCHPVGGQGLNLGIRDAAALAEVLHTAYQQNEDWGDLHVLKRYEQWRQPENLVMLAFTDFLVRCFSNQVVLLVLLRRLGLRLLQTVPSARRWVLRLMTGLSGRTPQPPPISIP